MTNQGQGRGNWYAITSLVCGSIIYLLGNMGVAVHCLVIWKRDMSKAFLGVVPNQSTDRVRGRICFTKQEAWTFWRARLL